MTEREAYIALNMMEKVGPVSVRSLSGRLGSAAAIFEAAPEDLTGAPGVGREPVRAILAQRGTVDWAGEQRRAAEAGARIVTQTDDEYPRRLREIHDPPLAFYLRGELQSRDDHALAVVGTRRPTHYGRACAERFGAELARAGFTVVSGLAQGIDTAAHEGALKVKGRTLAVLGGGLDRLYPPENEELARRIAASGAVLTEYPFGRQPDKTTFPVRNRIVSGLSMGILVVEAGETSGAMITADQALQQGRSVFAVPGRIDAPTARGPHRLIKQGARLVESAEDVLQEFEFLFPQGVKAAPAAEGRGPRPVTSADEDAILRQLADGELDVDGIIRGTKLSPATVSALLIGLEMKRMVRMLPGRIVEAVR
jgi:DNA processing protein